MNKLTIGLVAGTILGALDGLTAWFTPEVRDGILGIVLGSAFKGMLNGLAAGIFARRVNSTMAGVLFGFVVGLLLAYAIAAMQDKYYLQILLPGSIVGAIIGLITQRYPESRSGLTATG